MVRVCDSCRGEMDTNKISNLNGEEFELCSRCSERIIRFINSKKSGGVVSKLFGQ